VFGQDRSTRRHLCVVVASGPCLSPVFWTFGPDTLRRRGDEFHHGAHEGLTVAPDGDDFAFRAGVAE